MLNNKQIIIRTDRWTALNPIQFSHATDGTLSERLTTVRLKATPDFLCLKFTCENDPFVKENSMRTHNQPLYNQEVFEIFIALGSEDPTQYLEVEINPNDAIWVGKITNASLGTGGALQTQMVEAAESGIRHKARKGKNSWSGSLDIPWALISGSRQAEYRVNFYRIVARKSHGDPDWVCSAADCDFLCWNPTMSGAEPAFHRPKRFGHLSVR